MEIPMSVFFSPEKHLIWNQTKTKKKPADLVASHLWDCYYLLRWYEQVQFSEWTYQQTHRNKASTGKQSYYTSILLSTDIWKSRMWNGFVWGQSMFRLGAMITIQNKRVLLASRRPSTTFYYLQHSFVITLLTKEKIDLENT